MNPSTALARVLVDELVRGGVREAVLAPGSRSAPLALALHAADAAGLLRLHVRIDERSAGFLALGLAKGSGRPVPVVTTSGTAVANLHPAVLEAHHSGAPLLVLSADRPPELRGSGANQTIDQVAMFGAASRLTVDLGVPEAIPGQVAYWRATVCRALAAALGAVPGPVHLNLPLRDPLVPDGTDDWLEPWAGRADGASWTAVVAARPAPAPVDDLPARTVVVLGDGGDAVAAVALARTRGWPVVAEPTVTLPADAGDVVVAHGEALVAAAAVPVADRVLVVGRPTLSRALGRLVAAGPADVVAHLGAWPDPARAVARVLAGVPRPAPRDALPDHVRDDGWLPAWRAASRRAGEAVEAVLAEVGGLSEPQVARAVGQAAGAPGLLVVGSSKPVRDLLLVGVPPGTRVLANRGVAGIDGMVSTAVGAALAHAGHCYALLGDLTFLHDANGLLIGPDEPRPDLTIVVVNNDGGAIFGGLEQGAPEHSQAFERVFGTPLGVDLAALCAASGTPHVRVDTAAGLTAALVPSAGLRVVEVRTDRTVATAVDARLRAAVAAARA